MSVETVKKYVNITEAGASSTGKTKIWHVTGKGGAADGIGVIKWSGAWRKYVYHSDLAFYDADCLRLIADFCEAATKDHNHANY